MTLAWSLIGLVASITPLVLLAAVVRGGLRGLRDRAAARRDLKGFD